MTIIGCEYLDWSIVVRETYDTGSEYKYFQGWKITWEPKTSMNPGRGGGVLLHGVILYTYYFTTNMYNII